MSAFSVFSHLDHDEIMWFLELKRIVRKGGYLYLTIMDEFLREQLRKHDWLIETVGRGGNQQMLRDAISGDMPAERLV